jgi:hypothetical protein
VYINCNLSIPQSKLKGYDQMETIRKFKYKSSVGAYCLQITINGKPELVELINDCLNDEIKKKEWKCIDEI